MCWGGGYLCVHVCVCVGCETVVEIRVGGVIGEGKIFYDIKLSSEGISHQMLGALRPVVMRHLQRRGHICH